MQKHRFLNIAKIDYFLLICVLILVVLGAIFIYSASSYRAEKIGRSSEYFLMNHLMRLVIGIVLLVLAAAIPYQIWLGFSPLFYFVSICLLVLLLTGIPPAFEAKGSWRWLKMGPVMFQPSDFARYALVMFLARILTSKRQLLDDFWKGYVKLLLLVVAIVLPIALEKDLGTAILVTLISFSMFYFAEIKIKYIFVTGLSIFTCGFAYMMSNPYQLKRVMDYINQFLHKADPAWQVKQSLISLAQGGLVGQGIGNSRQKYEFLPEAHKDFIFAILGEEIGFIGAVLVILLFFFFIYRGIKIAKEAPDSYGLLLAGGITVCIGSYAFINIAVALGILPTTGIPMPFFSYGGSSLVSNLAAIGLMINISSQGRKSYANYFGMSTYNKRLNRNIFSGAKN